MFYGLYFNRYYMIGTIFVGIAMFIAMYAQIKVQTAYSKWKQVPNHLNMTGATLARQILDSHGLSHIVVSQVSGTLSDHYDPSKNLINLSPDIYNGTSIASLAVAAHECGHAIQYKENYMPIRWRNTILPIANLGQYLGWVAIIIGLVLGNTKIAIFGFIAMLGILLFQLITLPVEFDASKRGLHILQTQYLTTDEYSGASAMLSAAAMTYVAAVLSTLASMLRIFLLIVGNSRD